MKHFRLLVALLALFVGGGSVSAQTDVTSTYLTNADFSQGTPITVGVCTYDKDKAGNNTEYAQLVPVEDWTIPENGDARAGGLIAFGSGVWIGGPGYVAPATDSDGNTTGNILGLVGVWGGTAQYTQNAKVNIPAGTYTMVIAVYNSVGGTSAFTKNLIGFKESNGTEHYASTTSYAVNTWKYEFITFTLTEETSGTFSLGYQGSNVGSGNAQHLFLSGLTLFEGEVDAEAYEAQKEADRNAKEVEANKKKLEGSSAANPSADLLINGSFDTANQGWTLTNMGYQQNGERPTRYVEKWQGSSLTGSGSATQTIKNMPAGVYIFKGTAHTSQTENGGAKISVNADEVVVSGSWNEYKIEYNLENDGDITVTYSYNNLSSNWIAIDEFSLVYCGDKETYDKDIAGVYANAWQEAHDAAEAALANSDYANVTGAEKTALETEVAKDEPTTKEDYETATAALKETTATFIAAKADYDLLVAEKVKAAALGLTDAEIAEAAANTKTGLKATQDLKVAEYNYVTTNFAYGVELGEWTSTGTNTKAANFSNEHWSGTTHEYKNQDDSNGQGWNASSWEIHFSQDVLLPAGNYVFKVAGRQASGDQVNTELVVKQGDNVLGSVNDFPRSNNSRGINKSGATSFDEGNDAYANSGKGFGWEWRFVKFTLAEDATVNIAINSVATASHQWVSFGDYTVQTDNEAGLSLIEYNVALNDAKTAIDNADYANVTGEEKTALQAAIGVDDTLDKTSKEAIEAATETLKTATAAFTEAKAAYDAFAEAKNKTYENTLKYASEEKFNAIATAQAVEATTSDDATAKTNAIVAAYRKYVESHALAEGVEGAEQITIPDACMESGYNGETKKFGAWQVIGQTNGNIQLLDNQSFTDGDGKANYKYADIYKNDNNAGIQQTITLDPGKYMLTVTARANTTAGATFGLFAGDNRAEISRIGNTGGTFDRGWNDTNLEFTMTKVGDINIGVQSGNGKDLWWSATRFRLVKLAGPAGVTFEDAATAAPEDRELANVTYDRTLVKGFNTLVLPFDIAADELGENVETIYSYNGCTVTGEGESAVYHLDFQKGVETLTANTPYLVKMKEAQEGLSFTGKTINVTEAVVTNDYFNFEGTYVALEKGNTTIVEGDYISVAAGLKKAAGGNKLNAFRAYLKNNTGNTTAQVKVSIDGEEATAIEALEIGKALNGEIFNLQGQQVNRTQRGIYIVNGKKVIVK